MLIIINYDRYHGSYNDNDVHYNDYDVRYDYDVHYDASNQNCHHQDVHLYRSMKERLGVEEPRHLQWSDI